MKCLLLIAFVSCLIISGSCTDTESEVGGKEKKSDKSGAPQVYNKNPTTDPCPCNNYCGQNETYSDCVNGGCNGATYCSEKGALVKCVKPKHCYQGCVCEIGYLRDDNTGACILEADCPASCGGDINARPGCGTNCGRHCSDFQYYQQGGIQTACPFYCLVGGCDCKPGFLFDDYLGKCVAPLDCTKCPGPNEYYDFCPSSSPQTCASLAWNTTSCTTDTKCVPGCRCVAGYYRDDYGICVHESECQCNGDRNAVRGCGINCGRWCKDIGTVEPVSCIAVCYENACDCKEGYYFDEVIGTCVLPQECSRYKCTGAHEQYVPCADCSPQTCDNIGQEVHCPLMPSECCRGECRCEPGYRRNWIGDCIAEADCFRCTGPNEYYSCGGACDNVCKTLSTQNIKNCPIVNVKCNEMCYCKDGFARDENGICIPIDECPKECQRPNEHRDPCPPRCTPETCDSRGKEVECPIGPAVCQPACRCNYGFFRNNNGTCVPEHDCPVTPCGNNTNTCNGDPKAEPGCGVNCGRLCSNYDSIEPIYCPAVCHVNGCDCKKGYVFDETVGFCVHPKQCNRYKCLGPNEVFDHCLEKCPPQECGVDPRVVLCPEQVTCEPGCRCADGFVRNKEGLCVRGSECPDPECNGENEVLDPCFNGGCFGARNCSEFGRPFLCIDLLEGYCQKGCICKEGYLRNEEGCCIPEKECPNLCKGQNEVFNECTGSCSSDTCASLYVDNSNCVGPAVCIPACQCQEGYRRNENGDCIPIDDCPCNIGESYKKEDGCNTCSCQTGRRGDSICTLIACNNSTCIGKNEVFNECTNSCSSDTCASLYVDNSNCVGPAVCIPACQCQEGYRRNENGDCIPIDDCPCNIGETYKKEDGCNTCWCESGRRGDSICTLIACNFNPCIGKNEVFNKCTNSCSSDTCASLYADNSNCVGPAVCIPACQCQEGYRRNENGDCIPIDDCPCNIGESYKKEDGCNTCSCQTGRRGDSICTLIACNNNTCTGINEVFNECTNSCSSDTCVSLYVDNSNCVGPAVCIPACQCQEGYRRNDNGECIPIDDCPCNIGESYKKEDGCNTCSCETGRRGDSICTLIACNSTDPECNGENEVLDPCFNGGCVARNCSEIGKSVICYDLPEGSCQKGCVCKEGYLRNEEGCCIPKKECPNPCKGKNEVFNDCTSSCSSDTCASLYVDNSNCVGPAVCIPACQCQEGYRRNDNGVCIPIDDCPCNIGEAFKTEDGCNTCYCETGRRGDSACTLKACDCSQADAPEIDG